MNMWMIKWISHSNIEICLSKIRLEWRNLPGVETKEISKIEVKKNEVKKKDVKKKGKVEESDSD